MRRWLCCLVAAVLVSLSPARVVPQAVAQGSSQVPHAWLFGSWTGGLFPAPANLSADACLAAPTVIFTRDIVLRASLTDTGYLQRAIATVRATPHGFEFGFQPSNALAANTNNLLGLPAPQPAVGFGCLSADALHVERHGENEISFPGCADFPNPLVRCPSR